MVVLLSEDELSCLMKLLSILSIAPFKSLNLRELARNGGGAFDGDNSGSAPSLLPPRLGDKNESEPLVLEVTLEGDNRGRGVSGVLIASLSLRLTVGEKATPEVGLTMGGTKPAAFSC